MNSDWAWPQKTLLEVCTKITDGAHTSPKSVAVGKPMASVKDLTRFGVDLSNARLIAEADFDLLVKQGCRPELGDVLIAKDGNTALDTVCNVKSSLDAVLLSSVAILRPDPAQLDSDFLKFYLSSPDTISYLKTNFISGAAIPRVVLRDFKKASIPVPPLETQRGISGTLGALDERIALLWETNDTLEAIAQTLFKSWFVDFDPVRAKMEGRLPDGMDEATAALFPAALEHSEWGPIPQGWPTRCVDDVAERVGMGPFGSNIKVSTFVDDGIPVLNGAHVQGALLEDGAFRYITIEHAARLRNSCVRAGDIVLTHRGTLGQVALVPHGSAFTEYVLSQSQFFLRCDLSTMHPEWMLYFLRSPNGQHLLLANASQVGVPSIARPSSYLRSIRLVVPPVSLVIRFAELVRSLHNSAVENRLEAKTLSALRDAMLPRLLGGQLRLPGAMAQLQVITA